MELDENEEKQLRSVALQNARAILLARERAERELVEAKDALQESKDQITYILESVTDGFFAVDKEWRFLYLNEMGEKILSPLHKTRKNLLGKVLWEEFPDTLGTAVEENYRRAIRERLTIDFETFYPALNTWFSIRAYPSQRGLAVFFRDITKRKKAEEELQRQQQWFRVTLSSIGDAVITTDLSGRVTFLNPVAEAMTGWKTSEAAGFPVETIFKIIHEHTREPVTPQVGKVLREGVTVALGNHTTLISKDGRETAIEDSAAPIKDLDGNNSGAVIVFHDVTERRRVEEALRASEQRLQAIFNQAAVGIAIATLEGRFEHSNRRFSEILGYSEQELRERTFLELTYPDDLSETEAEVNRLLAGEISDYQLEKRYIKKDGTIVWSLTSVTLLKDGAGAARHLVGVVEDITERKRAEAAVREGAERLQLAMSAGQLGDWSWDFVTDQVSLGAAAARIFGLPEGARITWREIRELLHEGDRERARLAVEEALAQRSVYSIEYRVKRPVGGWCWVTSRGIGIYRDDGAVVGMTGVVQDTTERAVAEESRHRLAAVVESSDDSIISMTLDAVVTTWNKGAERMFGYTAEEVVGRPIDLLIPENLKDEEPRILERLKNGERVEHYETLRRRKDGAVLDVSLTVSPVHDANGQIIGLSKISRDITERKRNEKALREQTRALELLNDAGKSIAARLDLRSVVQTVTDSATQLSGAQFGAFFYNVINKQGEAFTLYTLSGAPREAFEKFGHPRATPLFGPTFRGEAPVRCDDVTKDPRYGKMVPHHGMPGGHLPVRSYLAVPVISRSGEVLGGLFFGHPEPGVFNEKAERLVVGIAGQAAVAMDNARLYDAAQQEIAERRKAEDALRIAQEQLSRHAEELEKQVAERTASLRETIGELESFSYSITHDMRAPLRAMQGFSLMLAEECGPKLSPEGNDYIRRIVTAAERMDRLILDVLTYSRVAREELPLEPVDLRKLLNEIMETYPGFQAPAADIVLEGEFPRVRGAEAVLTQCISNLLNNAVKFVSAGVIPCVRIWAEKLGDGTMVRVYFKDNGVGIKKELHERVFGIFQRVDNTYEGTGIGLAIVKKAVERLGGAVGLESELGEGSTFWLDLRAAS